MSTADRRAQLVRALDRFFQNYSKFCRPGRVPIGDLVLEQRTLCTNATEIARHCASLAIECPKIRDLATYAGRGDEEEAFHEACWIDQTLWIRESTTPPRTLVELVNEVRTCLRELRLRGRMDDEIKRGQIRADEGARSLWRQSWRRQLQATARIFQTGSPESLPLLTRLAGGHAVDRPRLRDELRSLINGYKIVMDRGRVPFFSPVEAKPESSLHPRPHARRTTDAFGRAPGFLKSPNAHRMSIDRLHLADPERLNRVLTFHQVCADEPKPARWYLERLNITASAIHKRFPRGDAARKDRLRGRRTCADFVAGEVFANWISEAEEWIRVKGNNPLVESRGISFPMVESVKKSLPTRTSPRAC